VRCARFQLIAFGGRWADNARKETLKKKKKKKGKGRGRKKEGEKKASNRK
jgi:hypothetical protein